MRHALKHWVGGVILGALLLSGTLVGGAPLRVSDDVLSDDALVPAPVTAMEDASASAAGAATQGLRVGAAAVSLAPEPPPGHVWKTEGCQVLTDPAGWDTVDPERDMWPSDPDCIYLGGFGVGPDRPADGVDAEFGVWAKAAAVSDGEQTVVLARIDAAGYAYRYSDRQCGSCGIDDIRTSLSEELGLPPDNIMVASSHSHSAADYLGGNGGVPDWYFEQTRDAIKGAIREAVADLRPASLTTGDRVVRPYNRERREFYRSAPDNQLVWLQAVDSDTGETITTVVTYAGHPTTLGSSNRTMHADWPGATEARLEQEYAGIGMLLPGGIGNMSITRPADQPGGPEGTGFGIAERAIASIAGGGMTVDGSVAAGGEEFLHPITNAVLGGRAASGFAYRPVENQPVSGSWHKRENRPCTSASTTGVRTTMGGFRIGSMGVMFGPGELFSSITVGVKDALRGADQVAVVSLANDQLGYLIPSWEFDPPAQQGAGFAGSPRLTEYEEAFSLDRCFGDRVLEGLIDIGTDLGL